MNWVSRKIPLGLISLISALIPHSVPKYSLFVRIYTGTAQPFFVYARLNCIRPWMELDCKDCFYFLSLMNSLRMVSWCYAMIFGMTVWMFCPINSLLENPKNYEILFYTREILPNFPEISMKI